MHLQLPRRKVDRQPAAKTGSDFKDHLLPESLVEHSEAVILKKSKYHIRVMRPTFERAILTVEASSEKAAVRAALDEAGRLTDKEWRLLAAETDSPVMEIALSEEETESSGDGVVAFLSEVNHGYALLQADLAEGDGSFIVPTWLRQQTGLAIADITQDWAEALAGIYEDRVEEFIAWLARQNRPTNVVDFFAERDKRRGKSRRPLDGDSPDKT